ncbi:MAG: sugar transferase [Cyanobacteria bacterium J06555_12]
MTKQPAASVKSSSEIAMYAPHFRLRLIQNRSFSTSELRRETEPKREAGAIALPSRVVVPKRLDGVTAQPFLHRCLTRLQNSQKSLLVLEFFETEFIDSCGIGALKILGKVARENNVRLVAWSVRPQIANALRATGCDRNILIDLRMQALQDKDSVDGQLPIAHASVSSVFKRIVDVVGGAIGLALTAVLFVPIAIAIKLDSPGPVLFSQTRLGYLGQPIRIWKFRSMVTDAEARKHEIENEIEGAFFKNKQDPRITRVGRFLRRTSLDEFPQFWCVLIGSMSLVGTRPPTLDEVEQYEVSDWRRLNVKAGLTGQWQVSGRSAIASFNEVVALDRAYQHQWSLLHDFNLIKQTVATVFSRRAGAV